MEAETMMAGPGRRPVVVEGLACPDPTVMAWEDGERDRWSSRAAALDHGREQPGWGKAVTSANRFADLSAGQVSWLIAKGPDGPARALLGDSRYLRHPQMTDLVRVAVARFELDALTFALGEAGEHADQRGLVVLPFRGPEAATLIAGWLRHLGSARLWARLWLHRHAATAARALVPAAAGRHGRARQNAGDALRHLAATGHGPIVLTTAEQYGQAALAAIAALLEPRPGQELPAAGVLTPVPALFGLLPEAAHAARKAKAPSWALPDRLPEIRLAGGGTMPPDDVARLVGALAGSSLEAPPEPPPGDPEPDGSGVPWAVDSAAAAQPMLRAPGPEAQRLIAGCDRRSLAEFGRALLDGWLTGAMAPSEAWALLAQGHIGDDTTMDVLAPLVRSWPAKSRHLRAIDGYAVLAAVGTDVALRHLLAIEANMSGGPLTGRAGFYLAAAAARRGLSVTQLADRLTVTHGLDTGVTLDYGPRTFTVVTDEHLTAYAVAADGRRLARPPQPGAKDSRPDAYQQFLQLKKDLRVTAAAQVTRLEREMSARRLRPARDLPAVVLPHPVLGPIARRLLWGEFGADGRLVRALRIAEDGSFADVHDTTATVDGDAALGIVHPAELGQELPAWGQIFADYEIVQPFAQLNRPVVVLTDAERAATSLAGFGPVPADRILDLLQGGWHGDDTGSGTHTRLAHRLPGGLSLLVEVAPGVPVSSYPTRPAGEQWIAGIWADDDWSDHWQLRRHIPMGVCDPAALSDLLVQVHALRG